MHTAVMLLFLSAGGLLERTWEICEHSHLHQHAQWDIWTAKQDLHSHHHPCELIDTFVFILEMLDQQRNVTFWRRRNAFESHFRAKTKMSRSILNIVKRLERILVWPRCVCRLLKMPFLLFLIFHSAVLAKCELQVISVNKKMRACFVHAVCFCTHRTNDW